MEAKTLALYLGSQVEYMGDRGYTLNKVEYLHESFEIDHDDSGIVEYFDCDEPEAKEIKLLLRPLSSMTVKEAKEYLRLKYNGIDKDPDVEKDTNLGNGFWFRFKGSEKKKFIFYAQVRDENYPEQFIYLLSKGFDLFGLIEKGEAIDSTTVNPKN